ncbi:hypothetical protein [Aquimarina algiphila]|uniref:Lipocalin-like domain-containing protein n=1 Tax=Aquimarina algiphila TaxID=2047982 RepID=A0A554VAG8_9FLAO|nr:hypothetical protein [Aquimarina algiphila]TSE03056.1 hypothetical protein FOF46_30115 [Aquimarina algiphila]
MKNKIIPFVSLIVATAFLFSCSSDDDGDNNGGVTGEVSTSKQYKNLEAATDQINDLTSGAINPGTRSSRKSSQKMSDCYTINQELNEDQTSGTVTIDFGNGCEVEKGDTISGKILMSFSFDINGENISITSNQTMENLVFNDMTVNGTTNLVISISGEGSETITTTSKIDFTWADGLTATIEETGKNEFFTNNETLEFYSLSTNNGSATFSNGDLFSFTTSTPLRIEGDCEYPVSGTIKNTENTVTKTLDFGDGECDSIVTVTDAEGNTTTVDLETTDEDLIF